MALEVVPLLRDQIEPPTDIPHRPFNMPVKQKVVIISALTCSSKSTLARVPDTAASNAGPQQRQHQQRAAAAAAAAMQFRTYTGPTVGEFLNKPGKKPLYVKNETKVRLVNGYEIIDLDAAPYRLESGSRETTATATTSTHDFARYRADMMLLSLNDNDDVDDDNTGKEEEEEAIGGGGGGGHRRRVILVSTHDDTREFLCREGWRYWLVYPARGLRAAWVQWLRHRDAGNPDWAKIDKVVRALDERFERFVEGVVAGLPVENQGVGGDGRSSSSTAGGSRPSWIVAGG